MDKQYSEKVIVSLHVADELIRQGFPVIKVKPSTARKGFAAFIFEDTPEFQIAFNEIANKKRRKFNK